MMNRAMFSSNKDTWGTPSPIRETVLKFGGYDGVVDPCPGESPVGEALVEPGQDGLSAMWPRDRLVYVNPPYGSAVKQWTKAAAIHGQGYGEVILLVASRTDTIWFHESLRSCDACVLLKGRLTFLGARDQAPFGSVLFYWGKRVDGFVDTFGALGEAIARIGR